MSTLCTLSETLSSYIVDTLPGRVRNRTILDTLPTSNPAMLPF